MEIREFFLDIKDLSGIGLGMKVLEAGDEVAAGGIETWSVDVSQDLVVHFFVFYL